MISEEKRAEIEAKYRPLLDELKAKNDRAGLIMTLMTMHLEMTAGEPLAKAEAIEK